jgi:hypothetical protein
MVGKPTCGTAVVHPVGPHCALTGDGFARNAEAAQIMDAPLHNQLLKIAIDTLRKIDCTLTATS